MGDPDITYRCNIEFESKGVQGLADRKEGS
jgi:hypothetical protein